MLPHLSSSIAVAGNRVEFIAEDEDGPNADAEYVYRDLLVKLQTSRSQSGETPSDVDQLLRSDDQKCNEIHTSRVNDDQLSTVSVSNTSSPAITDADAAIKAAKSIGASPSLHGKNISHRDISFIPQDDKNVHDEAVVERAEWRIDNNSTSATSDKLQSGDSCLDMETTHSINHCRKASDASPLTVDSSATTNEINTLNTKSSKCIVTSASIDSSAVKETFSLAGPKRVLSSRNSSVVVSSGSAVIKTGGKPPGVAANSAGNVTAKSDRLTVTHTPLIRSTQATHTGTATVSSAAVAVSQRKPNNAAVKIGHGALSRVTGLPPPIRLSSHSPQPPTEPASRPAVAAAQARFVQLLCTPPVAVV